MSIRLEEIRRWRNDEITRDFFGRVADGIEDMDGQVHRLLLDGEMEKAVVRNARLQQLREIEIYVTDMEAEAKGEDYET